MARSRHSMVGAAVRQALEGPVLSRAATLTGALLLAVSPPGLSLTVGEVNVRSAIGQRLVASVPVRIAEGESLVNGCASIHNGPSGFGNARQAVVTTPQAGKPGEYTLELTTSTALYEPMYELELQVDCPGAPAVVRQYVLMLDLPGSRYAADLAPAPSAGLPEAPTGNGPAMAYAPAPAAGGPRDSLRPDDSALPTGVRYRVREGDTLSSIAARVQGRRESLWTLAERIFAANPEAFIRGNPDLIRLGAEIVVPDGAAVAPAASAATPPAPMPAPHEPPRMPAALPAAVVSVGAVTLPATTPAASASPEPVVAATGPQPAMVSMPPAARATATKAAKPVPARQVSKPVGAEANASEPAAASPSPVAASIAGVVFGLVVSGLLWLGRNLPARKPWRAAGRRATPAAPTPVAEPPRPEPVPIPVPAHRPPPSFTVSYSQVEDDPLAGEFATAAPPPVAATSKAGSAEITSELEQLFGSTGGGDDGKTIAARAFGTAAVGHSVKPEDAEVDILLGEDSATLKAPAAGLAAAVAADVADPLADSGTVDLHALGRSTGGQQRQQARDLMDALSLLERDYEEELTASQVLDLSAMRQALDAADEDDEDTTLRQKSG